MEKFHNGCRNDTEWLLEELANAKETKGFPEEAQAKTFRVEINHTDDPQASDSFVDEILQHPLDHAWLGWTFPILVQPEFRLLSFVVGLESVAITVVGDADVCAHCGQGIVYKGFGCYYLCAECEGELDDEVED